MDIQVEERGDVIVARIKGRLDAASAPQIEKKLQSVVDQGHFKLVLNLSGVDYLSSAGMRLLLALSKKLQNVEGKLIVCGLIDEVMNVIKMAGFHRVLEFYATEEESLTHLVNV